jgi:Tol biopolymer transport system component
VKHFTLLFFVCSFLLLVCCGGGGAGVQSASNDIVFDAERNGNYDIFTVAANGQNEKNLTNSVGNENWPKWSSDGKKIAYSGDKTGKSEIYIMNSDGSGTEQLTFNGSYSHPKFSPLGDTILTVRTLPPGTDGSGLFLINLKSKQVLNVTPQNKNVVHADWSPSGKEVVFIHGTGTGLECYRMKYDSLNESFTDVKFVSETSEFNVSYSGDERWMLISKQSSLSGFSLDLHILNFDAGSSVRLPNIGVDSGPKFSSRNYVAIFRNNTNNVNKLYKWELGSSDFTLLAGDMEIGNYFWNKDASKIFVTATAESTWFGYVMDSMGKNIVRVCKEPNSVDWK